MRLAFVAVLLVSVVMLAGCPPKTEAPPAAEVKSDAPPAAPAAGVGSSENEKAAVAAADAWLKLVDEGKYAESWKETAGFFRKAVPQADWEKQMRTFRDPLGALESRTAQETKYTTSLPGAPDGEYVVIVYKASYAKKSDAIETVTPMKEADGTWRVSGYFIK